ncbi:NAD(P)-dependent dehydrogenase (short-subunit alcohol dehydrogenase family), partial [Paraburkholderia sp. JPY158]|nr:NAD(P)-dependent dehydrogenase (short-subunit alcohol dehydrogenase family) [Paraburkholderia atlantica]
MTSPLKVFITAASSGIGLALAGEYAQRGAILGLVARRARGVVTLSRAVEGTVTLICSRRNSGGGNALAQKTGGTWVISGKRCQAAMRVASCLR